MRRITIATSSILLSSALLCPIVNLHADDIVVGDRPSMYKPLSGNQKVLEGVNNLYSNGKISYATMQSVSREITHPVTSVSASVADALSISTLKNSLATASPHTAAKPVTTHKTVSHIHTSDEAEFAAPQDFTAQQQAAGSIQLSWTASDRAVSYNIYENGKLIGQTSDTNFTLSGVIGGQYDQFSIEAVDANQNVSDQTSVTMMSLPQIVDPFNALTADELANVYAYLRLLPPDHLSGIQRIVILLGDHATVQNYFKYQDKHTAIVGPLYEPDGSLEFNPTPQNLPFLVGGAVGQYLQDNRLGYLKDDYIKNAPFFAAYSLWTTNSISNLTYAANEIAQYGSSGISWLTQSMLISGAISVGSGAKQWPIYTTSNTGVVTKSFVDVSLKGDILAIGDTYFTLNAKNQIIAIQASGTNNIIHLDQPLTIPHVVLEAVANIPS